MIIGIYSNPNRDLNGSAARKLTEYLDNHGVSHKSLGVNHEMSGKYDLIFEQDITDVDMAVVFGGDGTVLSIVRALAVFNIPVFGINLGHLGFLTETTPNHMLEVMDKILAGEYNVEERAILEVDYKGNRYYAVNDISITRGVSIHTINIRIDIDGKLADKVRGDGVLVCTPTGSTAYSLSCGGPILSPKVPALTIAAICPHTLHSRPMVICDTQEVLLSSYNRDGQMRLTVDSSSVMMDDGEVNIMIKKSNFKAKFVRISQENFYNKLIKKMSHWNSSINREMD